MFDLSQPTPPSKAENSPPSSQRDAEGTALGRALLWAFTWMFTFAFGVSALRNLGRGTHTYGVAGRGRIRFVDDLQIPAHPFFKPGNTLTATVRHANVVPEDDAHKGFRGMALRMHGDGREGPFDLLMNTGPRGVFWHALNFCKLVFAGATGLDSMRKLFQTTTPPMHLHTQLGARRAPSAFSKLFFYARISFDYYADDGIARLARFRCRPVQDTEDTEGLPPEGSDDRRRSWTRTRLASEDRPPDYLRGGFIRALSRGRTIRYRLQIQIHECRPDDGNAIFDIKTDWSPEEHPWLELAEITLDRPLPEAEAEALEFGLYNMPGSMGVPLAHSITDYRSIGSMRLVVYRRLQAFRRLIRRLDGRPGPGHYPLAPNPHPRRGALNLYVPIRDQACEQRLDARLRTIGSDVRNHKGLPFGQFAELHFARFFILPGAGAQPSQLVYSANVDGRPLSHLYDLVQQSPALRELYECCSGYEVSWSNDEFYSFLLAHQRPTKLLYEGSPGRSAQQIAAEERLRKAICDFVEAPQRVAQWRELGPLEIVEQIRKEVESRPDELVLGPAPRRVWHQSLRFRAHQFGQAFLAVFGPPLLLSGLGLIVASVLGSSAYALAASIGPIAYITAVAGFLLVIRSAEQNEAVEPIERVWDPASSVREVANLEDHQVQNQLSMHLAIKSTWFRGPLLRLVLRVGHYLTRYYYNKGVLSGIPTIHFARFLIDDASGRMIFLSNYDGNWEEYLGDFLSTGAFAVVPIWTNCHGCPETEYLIRPTKGFGSLFRAYIRRHQCPTQIWYSAYRNLTLVNINDNTRMRNELWSLNTPSAAQAWLDRLAR